MTNSRRNKIVAPSEGQESVGSRDRDDFVNVEPRRDRALAQSPSIRFAPIRSDHISRSHYVSLRHAPRDQEMYDLRVEVRNLW